MESSFAEDESHDSSQESSRAATASQKHFEAMAAIEARIKEQQQEDHRKLILDKAKKTIQKLVDQGTEALSRTNNTSNCCIISRSIQA